MLPLTGSVAAGVLLGSGVFALDRAALSMIRPPFKPIRRKALKLPFLVESVSVPSGSQTLSGWAVRPLEDTGKPVLIMVHGWGSNHGTMTRLAAPLLEVGFPAFLFDVRHHGESRGAPFVTARHFRDDILAGVRKARDLFPDREHVLIGHSMGGSTGVLAVAEGAPVQGFVSIAAPADLWEVWGYHLGQRGLPGSWVVTALKPFWRIRVGVPWNTLDPRRRAGEMKCPVLVVHGEKDESVPVHHAGLLSAAAGVEPTILRGQGHTDLLEDPELHRVLIDFLVELAQVSS